MTFQKMFGAAQWITMPQENPPSILFRTPFASEKPLISATLTVVGLGVFEAAINGRAVSADVLLPLNTDVVEREFSVRGNPFGEKLAHRLYCPEYDVTHLIAGGENVLSVMTGSGWLGYYGWGCQRACFALTLCYTDGSVRHVLSGADTRVHVGFVTNGKIQTCEEHDYRGYDDAWMLPGFDDSAWEAAKILAPLDTEYMRTDCPADRVIRRIAPTKLSEQDGVCIFDCGENISGTPVMILRAPAGETVTVRVAERLDETGALHPKHMHNQLFTAVSDGKERVLSLHFTWFAFRYLEITGAAELVEVRVIHTDVAVTSSFDSDNDTLNWLYRTYIRTQLDNMHMGIPSDCPHIERHGYTGDGQLTAEAVMTMLDAKAFYKKWIGDISDCQDRLSGHVQYTAPYAHCGGGPGGWGCAIVEVPYLYWRHYGDTEVIGQLYPQMLRYFDYLDAHSENGLVVSDRPGEWCLGDWCTPEQIAIPEPFVNTYFYVKSIDRVIELAPTVGREAGIAALRAKREQLCARMTETYFDAASGDFCGAIQGANAFAVDIGLGDARTYAHMVEHYRAFGAYDTGIFGTDIVTRLLFAHGDGDVAAALLTSHKANGSFGHMQDLGCTTLLETWNTYARSDNHPMFGAVVRYLFQYILGIRQEADSCGWRRVCIAPMFVPQLERARGSVTVPQGELSVSWERRDTHTCVSVHIPDGVDARLTACGVERLLGAGDHIIELA